jgi:hypothetical protein
MDLTCYIFPSWRPRIRPASARRAWMDDAPEAYAYRCLPLGIANSHGWELLTACGFTVEWNGGMAPEDVIVQPDPGTLAHIKPVPLFGLGTFTIHVSGLFRTPTGWNLFVSGPPNSFKDGVAPLTGIIETDWSPYSFTMNWRLTRPNQRVRFEKGEPFAFFFPVQRNAIEEFRPRFASIDDAPELKASYLDWSRSRDAFGKFVAETKPQKASDKWQKLYYRGLTPDGGCPVPDHRSKLRVAAFANAEIIAAEPDEPPVAAPAAEQAAPDQPPAAAELSAKTDWTIAKYEWMFETVERQRALSDRERGVFRCASVSPQSFLDDFYALNRPILLTDAARDWPATRSWSPDYLRAAVGGTEIEYQGDRERNARFELDKDAHRQRMAFDGFIDLITAGETNDAYITAYNTTSNGAPLAPLYADLGTVPGILDHRPGDKAGMLWIGPKGSFTPMHHDLTNNLLVQVVGRKRVVMAAPGEAPKLSNSIHVFSDISDILAPDVDPVRFPRRRDVRLQEVLLEPGAALFLPIGWWHQVYALDFSVSITYTNFCWPNEGWQDHPAHK